MSRLDVSDSTADIVRVLAGLAGVSVDAYVRRLVVAESARLHAAVLNEAFYAAAETERLTVEPR